MSDCIASIIYWENLHLKSGIFDIPTKNALKMDNAWILKILLILWISQCCLAVKQQLAECQEIEMTHYNISCEGNDITLTCPEERPWLQVTSAMFGRTLDERQLCLRPGNLNPGQKKLVKCSSDVAAKVADICDGQVPCVFNVNTAIFQDPCPDVYKYIWVTFNCNCQQRQTRKARTISTCYSRKSSASSSYTMIQPTPTLTTIGQSMSQNVTNSTYPPIKMTATPTTVVSTQSLVITATSLVKSSRNVTIFAHSVSARSQTFLLLLELFVIYNEAANEDPPMALMWCFIGILLGLFILTITVLLLGLRRKPKDLFRLSQLESEEIHSPTIHTTSQFPDSPKVERPQTDVEKLNQTRERAARKNIPGSWSNLLKDDTSLYINPLWRGWREEFRSLGREGETELDHEGVQLSRSEPWNLTGIEDDADHNDIKENRNSEDSKNSDTNNDSTMLVNDTRCSGSQLDSNLSNDNTSINNSSGSDSDNISRQISHDNNDRNISSNSSNPRNNAITRTNNGKNVIDINPSCSIDPLRGATKKRRSIPEFGSSIPVGIPSHPLTDPQIFHTEPTQRKKKLKVEQFTHEPQLNGQKVVDDSTNHSKTIAPTTKLLARFGVDNENVRPTSRNTALSSPCLYNEDLNAELNGATSDTQDIQRSSNVSECKGEARPLRSRSFDSSQLSSNTTPLHATYNKKHNLNQTLTNHSLESPIQQDTTQYTTRPSIHTSQNTTTPYPQHPTSQNTKPHSLTQQNLHPQNPASHTPIVPTPTPTNCTPYTPILHQTKPPPFIKTKPNIRPKPSIQEDTNSQSETPEHLAISKKQPNLMKSPKSNKRASSGYYSNNSSPSVEHPNDITSSQNIEHKKMPQRKDIMQQSLDDDLPPLPPPPAPLIPISPLPYMCLPRYREPKTKNESSSDKNLSRTTAVKKVHFKPSE